MERGGYATTSGVRFQYLWVVRQLLQLLAEELLSVRIEPAGREGEGVDLIVVRADGTKEFQQCKRSVGQAGKWTLKALEAHGVLAALDGHLRADRTASFRLVSVDSAPELRDLGESARSSLNPESFHVDQIAAASKRRSAFEGFCQAVGLDPAESETMAAARDLLSRTFTVLFRDDDEELRELRSTARYWIDGSSGAVVTALESYAISNLRRAITAPDVVDFLRSQGLNLRVLSRDPRIRPAVEHLQEVFEASLASQLVGGRLLRRDEAARLVELLNDPAGPRFIALHGPAGVGKSGVLLDLTHRLRGDGMPFLPLRLDRQLPGGTTRQFGERLGFPESPALCLEACSGDRTAVLVLDQLDALRWTGAHAADALDTCRQLVAEAMRSSNLRVVACCRTFDLENDPQIRTWLERARARKIPVARLTEKLVRDVVSGSGINPALLSARELDLLRTIQHLRAWEETVRVTGGAVAFASEAALLDHFWRSRVLEAERMGIEPAAVRRSVNTVVEHLDTNSSLSAPRRLLLDYPGVEQALLSLNVLTLADNRLSFCHQTYLDHQLAHMLLDRIHGGQVSVKGWLTATHQGLYRREQLKLVLGMLREERFEDYLTTLQAILASEGIRFHLQQLTLQFLGQVSEPSARETALVLSMVSDKRWQEHVLADVFFGHPPWFDAARQAGLIAHWLDQEGRERERALRLIGSVIEERGEECCMLLSLLASCGEDPYRRAATVLPGAPSKDSPSLFELRIRIAAEGIGFPYLDWKGLGGDKLGRLSRLLHTVLSRFADNEAERHSQDGVLYGLSEVRLDTNTFAELLATWKVVTPEAARALGSDTPDWEPGLDMQFGRDWRIHLRSFLQKLAAEMVLRDAQATMDLADREASLLGDLLVLEALRHIDVPPLADRAIAWLVSRPGRLALRWSRSDLPWAISRTTVAHLGQYCSSGRLAEFERFLLEYKEPRFRRAMEWRHACLLNPPDGLPRFSALALERPSPAGQTAFHLLPSLPEARISDLARGRLRELQLKFSGVDELYFTGWGKVRSGSVGSPLTSDRLNSLSDTTWLNIIQQNSTTRPDARWSRRHHEDRFDESTPESFAADLQTATARQPGRFARLLMRFPGDANRHYFRAVVQGLRPQSRNDQPLEDATLAELEAALALPQVRADPSLASDVAWLVGSRSGLAWSTGILELIGEIATEHANPQPGELPLRGGNMDDWGPESLVNNALNCTRGAATLAVANLLFDDPRRLDALARTVERIALDPHPAVRAAAFKCCLAALEPDPDLAIACASKAAGGLEALLACSWFDAFLRFACRRHPEEMEPTLRRMLTGSRDDVVQAGARHIVALSLLLGRFQDTARDCVVGTPPLRRGAAEVAAGFADSMEHHAKAQAMLLQLMNDDDGTVLESCSDAFTDTTLETFAEATAFLDSYAKSRAFKKQPVPLLHRLREHGGSLVSFAECILSVCESYAKRAAEEAEGRQWNRWDADYHLPPILLRLYQQAPNGSGLRERCLDAWDLLLQTRVVSAITLTKQMGSE